MIKIAPSILSADFSKLGEEIEVLHNGGADYIHIDVMDGAFVPNITLGAPIVKAIRNRTDKVFDVHLMVESPSRYIDDFVDAGADIITIHYEAEKHIDRAIKYIKSKGIKAGVVLNPGTPTLMIQDLIKDLDMVLIMSVNPGFGGQSFIKHSLEKVKQVDEMRKKYNKDLIIEIDGGIGLDNIKAAKEAGVDVAVAGSAVYKNGEVAKNISELKRNA
ncbi:MAG: ribulose-phosphate 3-epimerase [Clostridium sp.]|uniref:ribulose-phosphate 3-epimerase n=1 Tax=Clostridium sp. TaxID=1506 RepID=UPI003F312688